MFETHTKSTVDHALVFQDPTLDPCLYTLFILSISFAIFFGAHKMGWKSSMTFVMSRAFFLLFILLSFPSLLFLLRRALYSFLYIPFFFSSPLFFYKEPPIYYVTLYNICRIVLFPLVGCFSALLILLVCYFLLLSRWMGRLDRPCSM
jgi:hypothetical protein